MSRSVTLELPDDVYDIFSKAAEATGIAPQDLAIDWLVSHLPPLEELVQRAGRFQRSFQAEVAMTEPEKQAARERFRQLAGIFDSGDPRFADNERIDADLAREYAPDPGSQS